MLQRTICFLNHLRISCRPAVQPPPNALVWLIYNSVLSHCHNTAIKIRKLKLIHYYHLSLTLCSGFDNCPSNVFYSKKTASFCSHVLCSVVMFLSCEFSFTPKQFFEFSLTSTCLKITGQLFSTVSLRFHVFPHDQFQVTYLLQKKKNQRSDCVLFLLHPNSLQYVSFLMMLTANERFLNICI